ncbi:MAG: TIR domain-containing protein [Clostridia bacterium]|nr:TIR domain-containing protein [Clostridia bacterium]
MLEMIQERIHSHIQNSISHIDTTVSAIEVAIQRIVAEHEAVELLLNAFECTDTKDKNSSKYNSQIELLREFIDELFTEKERLLTLLVGLDRLSEKKSGYPSTDGGCRMICVTIDELSVQANCLEETASLLSSDIDKSHEINNGAFESRDSLEIETLLSALGEYRASALKLKDACYESSKYLRQMRDEYSMCDEGISSGFSEFSQSRDSTIDGVSVLSSNVQSSQRPPVSIPPMQASYSMPAVDHCGGARQGEKVDTPYTGEKKNRFLGLFKRKEKGSSDIPDEQIIPPPRVDSVQFSAIAANRVVPGKYLPISIVMYEDDFRKSVDDIIRARGDDVKETKSGYHDVERNSLVRVVLRSSDVAIDDDEEVQRWNGKYLNFEFAAKVPKDFTDDQIFLTATVYINDLIATKLKLILECEKRSKHSINIKKEDVLSAFVSYASQDRNRVATIIQGMKKARPDMDIFFDIESLRSGQKWEEALKSEIENRDVLFLCWSKYARESKWVDMEWRYALESKGEDSIEPIPIDSPDICPPPVELQQKHFNDKMLFIIKATMPAEVGQPYLMRIKTNECMIIDKPVVRIGKEEKYVDLTIGGNAAVSRSHANIISREGSYYIVALNSTNRTYVDGQVIPSNVETLIKYGSRITLANEEFAFYC